MRLLTTAPLLFLAAAGFCAAAAAASESDEAIERQWLGKHREQVVERWGPPTRTKSRADGSSRLTYVRELLVGQAYPGQEYGRSWSTGKGAKPGGEVSETGEPAMPVYKKVKFRFDLDPEGRVTGLHLPKEVPLGFLVPARPPAAESSAGSPDEP